MLSRYFDERTEFRSCQFVGGAEPKYTRGFGGAQFKDTLFDPDAMAWVNMVQVNEGKRRYTSDDLANDYRTLISKFVGRGGLGLRTVNEKHLRSGPIGSSKYRDEIIQSLMSYVLEEHNVSGISGTGINVRREAEESIRFYATNNFMTGPLRDSFDRLKRKLGLDS